MSSILDVRLRGDGERLTMLLVTGHEPWNDEAEYSLRRLLLPLAERLNTAIVRVETDDSWNPPSVVIELQPPIRRRSIGQLLDLAEDFSALAAAAQGHGLTPGSTADLLRGGRPDALVGQPETDWLDAKRTAPQITSNVDKLSFAKDVAAFANSDPGGLLALALRTRRTSAGDVIERVTPFPANLLVPTRLRAIVRARVYAPPLGVRIEAIKLGSGLAVGLVHVPAQPPERKPFVVRGAVVDGRVREQFVGVPVRVGEDTVWDDLAGIHAQLVAGRVALSATP
ncbi:MAG TPA: hypothetical protein VE194_02430 [Rubrobacter sp.]|nr:hypothetical protein [Rubrobacter sp.]